MLTKLLGKQQIAQMTLYDYVNGITIGSIAATIATDEPARFLEHMLDLIFFAGLTLAISIASVKSRGFRRLMQGTPSIVVYNGQIIERNLLRNRYSVDDLKQKLRDREVYDISTLQAAILEPNGSITVLLKPEHKPVTRSDLHVQAAPERLPVDLIAEGQVLHRNLLRVRKDEAWLADQLRLHGYRDAKDVFYAALDSKGRFYVDPRGEDPREESMRIDP